jgi:hypothetical protein
MKCSECFFTDRSVDDEICRRCSRNFTRAELVDVILLGAVYLVLCRFSGYLFTGDFFRHPLSGGVFFPARVQEMFTFPVDFSDYPWQVLTVGWVFALVILIPVLVGLFYGAVPGMVMALGAWYVPAPFFFLLPGLGALVAGTRVHRRLSVGNSVALAIVPSVAYLLVFMMPALAGKTGKAAWAPWLVAVTLAAVFVPLTLRLARWRDYQVRFVVAVAAVQTVMVILLFQWTVGFAKVEYEYLRAAHGPLTGSFRILVPPQDFEHSSEDRCREAQELYELRRRQALDAFSRFLSRFPHASETPLALFEHAELQNLRAYFTGTRPNLLLVYADRISPEALADYQVIRTDLADSPVRKDFADSPVVVEARLSTARYYLQHHQLDEALPVLGDLRDFCDVRVPPDFRPSGGGSSAVRWRTTRLTPEERSEFYSDLLAETRRELRFVEQNSDYNRIPLMLFYQLDEHHPYYEKELQKILKWFPDSRLADNIKLALLERREYKLEELEALLAEYPAGDAAPRILLLLGEGCLERQKFAEAEKYLGRLAAEFGGTPEAARAVTVLERLKTNSRKTDKR